MNCTGWPGWLGQPGDQGEYCDQGDRMKTSRVTRAPSGDQANRCDRMTRVTGVHRMTRVRYLSLYLKCLSQVSHVKCFSHFLCVFVIVIIFVIISVLVIVFLFHLWIAAVLSFRNMCGYRGSYIDYPWSDDGPSQYNSTYGLYRVKRKAWKTFWENMEGFL